MSKKEELIPDPIDKILGSIFEKQKKKKEDYEKFQASQPYLAAVKHLDRLVADYVKAILAIELMATRNPEFFDQLIFLRTKSHLVQSIFTVVMLAKEGMHDPARRELRFLLELSIKTLFLDKAGNRKEHVSDIYSKIDKLDDLSKEKFSKIVTKLKFTLLRDNDVTTYRQRATDLYTKLSTHSHVSGVNIRNDLTNFDKGEYFGFETVPHIDRFCNNVRQVLDIALASHFEVFDEGLVGDILVNVFDDEPNWIFRKMDLVGAIDGYFDYKFERNRKE